MAFESLSERLNGVFKKLRGKGKLSEADIKAAMREVRMALLEADVNYKVAKDFCAQVSERAMGQEVMESLTPAQQVVKIVNEELTKLMGGEEPQTLHIKNKGQTVMMMCGLQGNGKTTHAAKLGRYYKAQGRRPLLVACDIYRPAALDQLRIVGEQAGVPVYEMGTEKPEKIAKQAASCHNTARFSPCKSGARGKAGGAVLALAVRTACRMRGAVDDVAGVFCMVIPPSTMLCAWCYYCIGGHPHFLPLCAEAPKRPVKAEKQADFDGKKALRTSPCAKQQPHP